MAGAVLVPLGGLALTRVRGVRELPYAVLPLVFGVHQLTEALVWAGDAGHVSACTAQRAAEAYAWVALPLLPLLVPLAVLLLTPAAAPRRRLWGAAFAGLGAAVTAWTASRILLNGVRVEVREHVVIYRTGLGEPEFWAVLYVVAVVGACLVSPHRPVQLFGALNLAGLVVVAWAYATAFASLWCFWAAVSSVVIVTHLIRPNGGRPLGTTPTAT